MHLTDEFKLPPKWTQSFGEELANTISHTAWIGRRDDRYTIFASRCLEER